MISNDIVDLVERARKGDRTAFGELCEQFRPTVYAVAMTRLRNPAEAEELAQEVFLHCMCKLPQLRDPQCFAGWVRKITVRMALNKLTRRGPFQRVEPEVLDRAAAGAATPLDSMVRYEQCTAVHAAIARLKALDRSTLVAFYLQGRSLKQMSHDFETPIGTIKRRLHVARRRLRRCLEKGTSKRSGRQRQAVCV